MRTTAIAVTFCALLTAAGCGGEEASTSNAQSGMRPPVVAAVDHPDAPVKLSIGDTSAPTDPVKTDTEGVLLPPRDVHRLGWWADSSLPGSGAGSIVITGHIDDVAQGVGFAKSFTALKSGDTVILAGKDGKSWTYRVNGVDSVSKQGGLPTERLNRRDGPETLALITCGGQFVGPPLGYANNEIAWAERVSG